MCWFVGLLESSSRGARDCSAVLPCYLQSGVIAACCLCSKDCVICYCLSRPPVAAGGPAGQLAAAMRTWAVASHSHTQLAYAEPSGDSTWMVCRSPVAGWCQQQRLLLLVSVTSWGCCGAAAGGLGWCVAHASGSVAYYLNAFWVLTPFCMCVRGGVLCCACSQHTSCGGRCTCPPRTTTHRLLGGLCFFGDP